MEFSFRNLNVRKDGSHGTALKAGRCSAYFGGSGCNSLDLEWGTWYHGLFSLALLLGRNESPVSLHVGVPYFTVYLSWENYRAASWLRKRMKDRKRPNGAHREFSVKQCAEYLWINFYGDTDMFCSGDPWWYHVSVDIPRLLLGRERYSDAVVKTERVEIPMPEKAYPATIEWHMQTWKRPRWPFTVRRCSATVIPDEPIPEPGKGENSYDCEEDAMHSISTAAETSWGAIGRTVEAVMRQRIKYGGSAWRPKAKN
jgi:hypothetical protein